MVDTLLRGGSVMDGTGRERFAADVLIRAEQIVAVGNPEPHRDCREIDVSGLVIAPGFIDLHAHSDLAVLADRDHVAKVAQGVTTEVVGQDGMGYAPVDDAVMATMQDRIAGWNGHPQLDYQWRSVGDYLSRVDRGAAVNVATLIPHANVRMMILGDDPRPATGTELAAMRAIIAAGMRAGAMGLSVGLTYTPGLFAGDAEIIDALRPVSAAGGYYCPHHRSYGRGVIAAYRDCIAIAAAAGVGLHLTHCNINFPQNEGRATDVLAAVDAAVDAGQDVTLDSYPYLAGSTYLSALLPSWCQQGGPERTRERLQDPRSRQEILEHLEVLGSDGHHGMPIDWHRIVIASTATAADWAPGRSIAELAAARGTAAGELFCGLLLADDLQTSCLVFAGNEQNALAVMRHRRHSVGSDGILVGERPHPRGFGTFPRFIGHYAREHGLMTMEEAVCHATGRPADRLGLTDRGRVAGGYRADIVVFDPDRIDSPADYDHPTLLPTGIEYVFVNGVSTWQDGQRTGALPGRAIRHRSVTDPHLMP